MARKTAAPEASVRQLDDDMIRVIEARHHDPFCVLGRHPVDDGVVVRAFVPYATEVTIAETSSAQGTGKAKWFEDLFSLRRFTRLRRVIFFHENKERDWRLNSDPNTLAVCRRRLRQSVGALPAPA